MIVWASSRFITRSDGNTLVFASEIKAILASDLIQREINPRALWDFLTLRYVPSPETIWRGIFKLPPGHRLSMEEASIRTSYRALVGRAV